MSTVASPSSTNSTFSGPEMEKCPYMLGVIWRKSYLTDVTFRNLVAVAATNSVALILNVLLNLLVIFALATRRPLRITSNILLACLAGSDLLTGFVAHPVAIAVELKRIFGDGPFCALEKAGNVIIVLVTFASLNHLLLIGIDRYVAIKHALRYPHIVTNKRIRVGVISAWAVTAFITIHEIVVATLDSETKTFLDYTYGTIIAFAIIGFLYICAIGYIYVYIFRESRRQSKRLQTEQLTQEEAKRLKKNKKAATTLAIILGALIFSYLPAIIFLVVISSRTVDPHLMCVLLSWCSTFIKLGSLVNPLIYSWRTKKLRRAFLEIFHLRQPENKPPEIEMLERRHYLPEVRPTSCEAFSAPVLQEEPVLLSYRQLQDAEATVSIPPENERQQRRHYRTKVQPTSRKAFLAPKPQGELVLLSYRQLEDAEAIVSIPYEEN